MGAKKVAKRSKVKPFIKVRNSLSNSRRVEEALSGIELLILHTGRQLLSPIPHALRT